MTYAESSTTLARTSAIHRRRLYPTAALTLVVICSLIAQQASAAFGPVARISNTGKRPNRGDTLTVESDWIDSAGYRPVRFQLDCVPSTADRTLTIEFQPNQWYGPPLTVAFDLDVPAGSAQVVKELSVPQYQSWQMFQVIVSENGRQNEELSGQSGGSVGFTGQLQTQWPTTLLIGEWAPDVDLSPYSMMSGMGGTYSQNPNVVVPAGSTAPKNFTTGNMHALSAASLPKNWVNYTGLDVICLSLDELEKIKSANPEALAAIRNWTAAGGNLWIHGVEHAGKQTKVDEVLDLPPALKDVKNSASEEFWRPGVGNAGSGIEAGAYAMRDFQRGRMVGVKKDLQNVPGTNVWQVVRDEIGMDRYLWHRRYGTTLEQDNSEFWNFLIPGVGLAPVNAYRLLITLFVIVIGPINYGLLYRYRRLHLLMFTVPASAVVVATGLIGYALAADGLETRIRARTFTEIDQRRGEAISAARLSYYAAVAPSGGLTFPVDTAVFPLQAAMDRRYYRPNRRERREMSLVDDQRMTRGWLNSRTHTQYVVGRISPSKLRLDVIAADGAVQVRNKLDTTIQHLLLFDEQGDRYYGSAIIANADVKLAPIAGQVANDQPPLDVINQLYISSLPRDTRPYNYQYTATQPYAVGPGMPDSPDRVTTASSRLEVGLQEHLQNPGQRVRPRSYVAIVSRNPHVPLGVESANETGSFHVIVGYW